MLEAIPPGALEGMDMDMIREIPLEAVESVDWASVPPEAMEAGFTAFQDGLANGMSLRMHSKQEELLLIHICRQTWVT